MPKLNGTTAGIAALGGIAGAAYLNQRLKQDPSRGPWDPSVDLQTHYDYIILGGKLFTLQARPMGS